jgi:surfactin synthase thioesterase subunit
MDDLELFSYLTVSEMLPAEIVYGSPMWEIIAPAIRADILAIEDYKFRDEDPLTVPITAVMGDQDRWITRPIVEGWGRQTNDFEACSVVAGHLPAIDAGPEVVSCIFDRWLAPPV